MVKLLETSGVIEKTHVVLCAEHGPNKRTVSVSCMRVSFHFFFWLNVVLTRYWKKRRRNVRRVTTAAANHTHEEMKYEPRGRHSMEDCRTQLWTHFDFCLLFCVRFRVILIIIGVVHGRTQNA